jgi:hypothetical protein
MSESQGGLVETLSIEPQPRVSESKTLGLGPGIGTFSMLPPGDASYPGNTHTVFSQFSGLPTDSKISTHSNSLHEMT